jgi:hypothetical protein
MAELIDVPERLWELPVTELPAQALGALADLVVSNFDVEEADLRGRPVVVTPVPNHYGAPGHWVLSFAGSPPRGTILLDAHSLPDYGTVVYGAEVREFNEEEAATAYLFLDAALRPTQLRPTAAESPLAAAMGLAAEDPSPEAFLRDLGGQANEQQYRREARRARTATPFVVKVRAS